MNTNKNVIKQALVKDKIEGEKGAEGAEKYLKEKKVVNTMKKILLLSILESFGLMSGAQLRYLSDIVITQSDVQYGKGYTTMSFNYWRYDSCLYSKQMCKYNSATAASVRVSQNENLIIYEFLRGNNSGYQSRNPYDSFKYVFVPQNINASKLVRKLLIKDKYIRADTFALTAIDTLLFNNAPLVKKVFGKSETLDQTSLKIYVLKSIDEFGSTILHYWVERIGIIKIADEKCWRYSFEMNDNRTKSVKKLFEKLFKVIKAKYKDPYWLGEPCGVELLPSPSS